MEELTIVYVWNDKSRSFKATRAKDIRCPECNAGYLAMWWDTVCPGEPFLQCDCDEQFSTISESEEQDSPYPPFMDDEAHPWQSSDDSRQERRQMGLTAL